MSLPKQYINEYGHTVPQEQAVYTITLQGSYEWSHYFRHWKYEIESVEPPLPLKIFRSEKPIHEQNER